MTQEPDDGIRSNSGFLISLRDLGNGKGRLSFDDVINDSSSIKDDWKHEERFIFKDYGFETLENFRVPKNELAEIGQVILTRALAKHLKKTDRQKLIKEIRQSFEDAEFPYHMGLIAAEAVDDWICDKKVLQELTQKHDFQGAWWDIPESHLTRGSLGLNYLDSTGMAFYLPAFMTLSLEKPEYKYVSPLVFELNPVHEGDEDDLYSLFCDKFSKIKGKRKEVCIKFLKYMKEVLLMSGHHHISDIEDIDVTLKHEFWKTDI